MTLTPTVICNSHSPSIQGYGVLPEGNVSDLGSQRPGITEPFEISHKVDKSSGLPYSGGAKSTGAETDRGSDCDDEEDDEWSGEADKIEAAVLASVPDLKHAAWLIVDLYREYVRDEECKIGGWQEGVTKCQGSQESPGSQQPFEGYQNYSSRSRRKRRRHDYGSDNDDGGDKDDEDRGGSPPRLEESPRAIPARTRKFACPFYKLNPQRYCENETTRTHFRVCRSGFVGIRRVKSVYLQGFPTCSCIYLTHL
jgi:hypothetical protein